MSKSPPSHRYLFWTEWGQYPRIERSRLDGTQRAVLVNVSISWPNGISIDYQVWSQTCLHFLVTSHDPLHHGPHFKLGFLQDRLLSLRSPHGPF